MPCEVFCSACGKVVSIPEGIRSPWVECPHCRARVVNPQALEHKGLAGVTGTGVLGTLLLLLGTLGWLGGCGAIVLYSLGNRQDARGDAYFYIHTISSAFLLASGVMLLLAGKGKPRRPFLLAAAGLGVLAALALLITSGLIVIFATCLGGC